VKAFDEAFHSRIHVAQRAYFRESQGSVGGIPEESWGDPYAQPLWSHQWMHALHGMQRMLAQYFNYRK
jgi:hypothetical protein